MKTMASRLTSRLPRAASRHLGQLTSCSSSTPAVIFTRSVGTFRPSPALQAKTIVDVPTMGDSITEGTIVEWAAKVGEAVKEGDVIALMETDKVTIDIKADMDGVIVEHFGEIDETVEVGAKLYEIDTEGSATVVAAAESESASSSDETVEPASAASASNTNNSTTRIPSIKFLGKDGWKNKLSVSGDASIQKQTPTTPLKPHGSIVVNPGGVIGSNYGRLPFSEREIEALEMGGASEAPCVNTY
jgi:glycine cleavage system H lipoate-binding protein